MTTRGNGHGPRPSHPRPTPVELTVIVVLLLAIVGAGAFAATLALTRPAATDAPSSSVIAETTTSARPTGTATPAATETETATPAATETETAPTSAPTQPPTATPTQAPTPTPAPTRTATARPPTPAPAGPPSTYVAYGSRSSGKVALTFDFGGRVGDAKAIVNYLIAHDIHASVFITGKQIDTTDEGPQVLQTICPRTAEFAIGNHSYTHPDFSTIPVSQMRTELSSTEAAFAKYCNRSPRPYFRPPGGALGSWQTAKYKEIMATLGSAGYAKTIMWDCDTIDWSSDTSKQEIIDRVHANAKSGSIVLMHLGGWNTLAALPSVLADVRAKGLTPVTLDELGI